MTSTSEEQGSERALNASEKRTLVVLGVPTLGLALSITAVSTYLPKVARQFTNSTTVIGLIVGAEGLMALWLPLVVGTWSDGLRTRLGGRLPFVIAGVPVAAAGLVLMGFVGSLFGLALVVGLFFIGYFIAYEPYRALYPDLVEEAVASRAQGTQALWRGAGTGLALVGGGLLLSIGRPVPFVVGAIVLLVAVGIFLAVLRARRGVPDQQSSPIHGVRQAVGELRRLLGERPLLRAFLVANALWELSLAALKTFVVLYITEGLGQSLRTAALIVGVGALIVLLAAALVGKLTDRFGRPRVMYFALWVYGLGLLVPFITQSVPILVAILPFAVFAGGVIMTLPYALLIPLMPDNEHGALSGFYSLTRGLGTMLGPLLAGVAVQVLRGPLPGTHGYQAMWLVCSLAIGVSLPFSARLRREGTPSPG